MTVDPITFEVIKNALDSVADEMAIVLMRSAYSPIVRDSLDFSTAFCNHEGVMVSQGLTTPFHLGSFPDAMRHLVKEHAGLMRPGDIFTLNDPYGSGGMHLPDIYVIKPIFFGDAVEGFAATLAHHTDVGGISPGSNSVHSTEIYQEGLRIPLLKLYDEGRPNETLFKIIEKNVRVPVKVLGDFRAQVAACHKGEQAFVTLLQRYGAPVLRYYLVQMLDYAERIMRAEIASLPDGTYEFTDFIDGLGDEPEPIVFHVKVTVAGDSIVADWTGSSPQVRGGLNSPMPFTKSAAYLAVRVLVDPSMPNSEGYMRPISVIAPSGTIMNPLLPAPCAARGITGLRMFDALLGALSQAAPRRVPAAGEGGASIPSFGGYQNGEPFVNVETIYGTWGGRPNRDGAEGMPHPGANQSNQPIELIEADLPLRIQQYSLVQDSGGPGKYRGGLALVREYRILAEEASFTIRSDRRAHPPYGLQGGKPGSPSWNILNPGPHQKILPVLPMQALSLKKGDVFRHILPGGGGYGDPLERDPLMVLEDVLDEKLSVDYARRVYGVIINRDGLSIDVDATTELRRELNRSS
jgi:N-methylhydantoinase B